MKRRKTVEIRKLIAMVNAKLAADETAFPRLNREYRQTLSTFLETILMDHGAYRGFSYLSKSMLDNPEEVPGINTLNLNGREFMFDDSAERFRDTDDSRIFFLD